MFVHWSSKVRQTVQTPSQNTGELAFVNDHPFDLMVANMMVVNARPNRVFRGTRQIPVDPAGPGAYATGRSGTRGGYALPRSGYGRTPDGDGYGRGGDAVKDWGRRRPQVFRSGRYSRIRCWPGRRGDLAGSRNSLRVRRVGGSPGQPHYDSADRGKSEPSP
jgi:hypothetical protein